MSQFVSISDAMAVYKPADGSPSNPPVYIVVEQPKVITYKEHFTKTLSGRCSYIMSALQIASCICAMVAQGLLLGRDDFGAIGSGFYGGILFGISGVLGLFATSKPSKCSVISFLVTSIISIAFCIILLTMASVGLAMAVQKSNKILSGSEDIKVTLNLTLVIIAVLTSLICIISSAISCKAICCRKTNTKPPVVYTHNGNDYLDIMAFTMRAGSMEMNDDSHQMTLPDNPPNYEDALNETREKPKIY